MKVVVMSTPALFLTLKNKGLVLSVTLSMTFVITFWLVFFVRFTSFLSLLIIFIMNECWILLNFSASTEIIILFILNLLLWYVRPSELFLCFGKNILGYVTVCFYMVTISISVLHFCSYVRLVYTFFLELFTSTYGIKVVLAT